MKRITLMTLILITLFVACTPAETVAPVSDVPAAEASPLPPTNTIEPTPDPTETLAPTPTAIPTITPTPGPVSVQDDFSTQTDNWEACDLCQWKNGALAFGPNPPKGSGENQIFYVVCQACGLHTYYRVSADVTFTDGYGDRTFGILAGLSEDNTRIAAGTVSTFKHALYEIFDFTTNTWVSGTFKRFNAVGAGYATNRIQVEIEPASASDRANIFVRVNGTTVISLFEQPIAPSWAGLYLGWHTVGAAFDNFEYEELSPP